MLPFIRNLLLFILLSASLFAGTLPLVLETTDDPAMRDVLFLVKSKKPQAVVAFAKLTDAALEDGEMERLKGTNLWYKWCRLPADTRLTYCFSPNPKKTTRWKRDRQNPLKLAFAPGEMNENKRRVKMSVLALPKAPSQKWAEASPHIPHGKLRKTSFKSRCLKNRRKIWIYTPAGYSKEERPYRLLLLFDGEVYQRVIPTPTILDNLIAAKAIEPTVAVMVGCVNEETRNRELPCNPRFHDFLLQELLPWVEKHFTVSKKPQERVIGGFSYGSLAALYTAMKAPDCFGNVLSQSGAFWWKKRWLSKHVQNVPKQPLRIFLNVGTLEIFSDSNLLDDNRHMKAILEERGYPLLYREFSGGHDYIAWQDTLPEALMYLLN